MHNRERGYVQACTDTTVCISWFSKHQQLAFTDDRQHISPLKLAQIFFREGAIVKEGSLVLCAPDITSPYTNWQHMVYFLKWQLLSVTTGEQNSTFITQSVISQLCLPKRNCRRGYFLGIRLMFPCCLQFCMEQSILLEQSTGHHICCSHLKTKILRANHPT